MKFKPIHIVFLVLILGTIFYFIINDKNEEKKFKWYKTYENTKDEPYDFGVFNQIIKLQFKEDLKIIDKELVEVLNDCDSTKHNTYFFMGHYPYYSKKETDALLDFAAKGNSVFLVVEGIPDTLLDLVNSFDGKQLQLKTFYEDTVTTNFQYFDNYETSYTFKLKNYSGFFNQYLDWNYFDNNNNLYYYNENTQDRFKTLGFVNNKINFIKIKHHRGFIYLHSNPILFTNYVLLEKNGFNYVNEIVSKEIKKTVFYRDFYNLKPKPSEKQQNSGKFSPNKSTPLSFILDNESFRWAWYVLLLLIVLFFVFRAKRHQRLIPVMRKKSNSSVEYANTISNLYFNHSNHTEILKSKHQHWLFFIRTKLNIFTNEINDKTIENISKKSGVSIEKIKSIFYYSEKYLDKNLYVNNETFIEINAEYDYFYKAYKLKNK